MDERALYDLLIPAMYVAAGVVFAALLWVAAPYDRHGSRGWGATISSRWGWRFMEAPAALVILICALFAEPCLGAIPWVLLGLWEVHYFYRAFIYPSRRRDGDRCMPWMIVAMGMLFNGVNGYLNGRWLFAFAPGYGAGWWTWPGTWLGLALYGGGMWINRQADAQLRALRKEREAGYGLPQRGMFRWIDCPNYFGELIQWVGWGFLCRSAAAWAFAVWTAANLVPRARSHHRWYRERFPDYPRDRKALLPYVW